MESDPQMDKIGNRAIMNFPAEYTSIVERVENFDPRSYASTRNFENGSVSYLSPYISRGVISTKRVFSKLLERGFDPKEIEKYIQELAWRDYWQIVWKEKGSAIDFDLNGFQEGIEHFEIPLGIIKARTGVPTIDRILKDFYNSGYMHNHARMYVASLICNIGKSHWLMPARWMYFHLLDADWASNALSWQWVVGTNSKKKYLANQANINHFFNGREIGTYLDHPLEELPPIHIPKDLEETIIPIFDTPLPETDPPNIITGLPIYLYTHYNLDPGWEPNVEANRILILEPSHFKKYPISPKSLDFVLDLGRNIHGLQLFVGEFQDFQKAYGINQIHFKEHPFSNHFKGTVHKRDWLFEYNGYHNSFFGYWNQCKKELKKYLPKQSMLFG